MGGQMSSGCELLSKVCIFAVVNIDIHKPELDEIVVNCFQKFVSLQS